MSTSLLYHAFGVRGYRYLKTGYVGGEVIFTIEQPWETCRCSACGSENLIGRGKNRRRFRTVPIGGKPVYLELSIPRVECRECNVVRQVEIGFADPRVTYTKAFAALCFGTLTVYDHPGRCRPFTHQLGRDQGNPKGRPETSVRQAEIETPATDRHRRNFHRQGARLPDTRLGPGQRSGGPRRLGKRRGRPEELLETASATRGPRSRPWPRTCRRPTSTRSQPICRRLDLCSIAFM